MHTSLPGPLTHPSQVRELYEVLRIATRRVSVLLNEYSPTYRLPPEILTRILSLAVDHGSEEHAKQIIPLTHVCRYWRTLILSYPRMWSTLCMKPGNPVVISEWLARSQNVPLTIIAEFTDAYEHPLCRYQDSETAVLENPRVLRVCPRHKAILSLDQLLPHHSRIHDLKILFHSSDPDWADDDHRDEALLFYHRFFEETLPNLQCLDFRATHVEQQRYTIPIPAHLFAGKLPRLKELKYLGATEGLMETARDLAVCKIGHWSGSVGPTVVSQEDLQTLFSNNKTVRSLTLNELQFFTPVHPFTTITPMTDLKFLKIHCPIHSDLEIILKSIHIPQFKSLDTVRLSLQYSVVRAVATDGFGHTFEFLQAAAGSGPNFYPLRHLGANITTLRLDQGMTLERLDERPGLYEIFRSLDAVRVLEFDGTIVSAKSVLYNVVSIPRVLPGLRVIRVAIGWDECKEVLENLATAARLRMEMGNPIATIEPFSVEGLEKCADGEGGLGQELRAEWEKHYEARDVQNFLS